MSPLNVGKVFSELRLPEPVWGDDVVPYKLHDGHASGWHIQEHPPGLWSWTAWGPKGRKNGGAESEADARKKARYAEKELSRDA